MTALPAVLEKDAQDRWDKVTGALKAIRADWPETRISPDEVRRALVFSDYLIQQCIRWPAMLDDLLVNGDLGCRYKKGDMRRRLAICCRRFFNFPISENQPSDIDSAVLAMASKSDMQQVLRRFRHREMVRIALRDLCGRADLSETMADLSELADVCLGIALDYLFDHHCRQWGLAQSPDGQPQHPVIIGLGKLGAWELNFSSDVDLMFAYPQDGRTAGGERGRNTNHEFFARLYRDLIQMIGSPTPEGFVFRVDARLRPFGESGPLCMSFDKLEDYYQEQGREWERYALIKARIVAGDSRSGDELLRRLKPFVFRRYLDYGAFESLREMKARIAVEVNQKGRRDDIKLGPGGIREIEFFGQMFQLIRGGVEQALQIGPIQKVLAVLVDNGYISPRVGENLSESYIFLRTVENRLQQWADQQTHRLPTDTTGRLRLAVAMGFADWPAFESRLNQVREQVHGHFDELLAPAKDTNQLSQEDDDFKELSEAWTGYADPQRVCALLKRLGYAEPETALKMVQALRQDRALHTMSPTGQDRLRRLIPLVLQAAALDEYPDKVLGRIFDLIRSIHRRTSYLALLLENPSALTHLVRLVSASPWIASFLAGHPVLLDELLDPRHLYRPPLRHELRQELRQRLATVDTVDLEYQMEVLRVFKQVSELRVAASDITSVLPLMKVSDHLSYIAEVVLESVVELCWRQMKEKYGMPACRLDGGSCDRGFAVVAYGKLGGLELGYGSDLDLVFLHAAEPGQTTGGARTVDNAQYFSRLGQRVLHMLTTHTPAGRLYEADMRLRPSGDSGMLVCHVDGFSEYQHKEAWTWEHQALIRARTIVGDAALQQRFEAIRRSVLTQQRDPGELKAKVTDMRDRLRRQHIKPVQTGFDIKQGPGGIVDIEFLVQYLVLKHAHRYPEIIRWTDNVRLLQALNEAGVLGDTTAFGLRRAYLILRAMVHRLNLRQQPAIVDDDRFTAARNFVRRVWERFLGQV